MHDRNYPNDAKSILAAAKALVPLIVENREEIECERRLPLRLVDALKQARVFRMTMPRAWRQYRASGGKRGRVAADFLIGVHSVVACNRLLIRDQDFYRSYFKGLVIVDSTRS